MEIRKIFKIPRYTVGLDFKIVLKPREGTKVIGVCNRVGQYYVVFLDYDYTEKSFIIDEIKGLQAEFILGDAFLFKTANGFHVIMLDLLSYDEFKTILEASSCDEAFKAVPTHNNTRAWVLRLSDKKNNHIKYDGMIEGYLGRTLSSPHAKLLRLRGVPEKDLRRGKIYSSMNDREITYAKYEA